MVKCSECDTENPEDSTHCQNCGRKLIPKKNRNRVNKILLVGLVFAVVMVIAGAILVFTTTSEVSKFDQALINSVKNGNSSDSLISQIKEHSEANRQGSKEGYDNIVSRDQTGNSTFLAEAKTNHDKELAYIQKIEDLQIRFAKREINEETFIKELKQLYEQQPELDY